jgi:CxxC-x17-CxxC domain-containing protein
MHYSEFVASSRALREYKCPGSLKQSVVIKGGGASPPTGKNLISREVITMYEDKTLVCKECGNEFVFTAGEQEFYAEKGFVNEPQRCKSCRYARKNAGKPEREMFTVTCATCGKEDTVPFRPREDRPVYCKECFAKTREA